MRISYDKFGLKEVINASGKMTILGVSKISENVLAAQRFGGEHFFEMSELFIQTGAYLAKLLKADCIFCISRHRTICRCDYWTRQFVSCLSPLYRSDQKTRDHCA